jgi:hypothetical protein
MKYARELFTSTLVGGMFVVVPVYLAVLLLLKGMKSAGTLVRPFAALLPDWLPAEDFSLSSLYSRSALSSASPSGLEQGAQFESGWRWCSSRDFRVTACCAI